MNMSHPSSAVFSELKIPVPWGHIAAKTFGKPTEAPVLLIHDWLDNSASFDKFVPQFAASFDKLVPLLARNIYIVTIDLPGHGLSSPLPKGVGYHLVDYVPVLNRVIKHFGWKKVSILGHGTGAGLAILYTTVYSFGHVKEVERIILLNTIKPPSVENEGGAAVLGPAIDELIDYEEKGTPVSAPQTFDECLESFIVETGNRCSDEVARLLMTRGAIKDSEGNWSLSRDARLKIPDTLRFTHDQCFNLLSQIEIPVVAIKTPDNSESPRQKSVYQKCLEILKNSSKSFRLIEIEGNHYTHVEQPESIVDVISEFLLGRNVNKGVRT